MNTCAEREVIDINKHCKIIVVILLLSVVVAALLRGFAVPSVNSEWSSDEVIMLKGKWNQKSCSDDSVWEGDYRIPEGCGNNLVLSLESFWCSFQVLLDGEELYSYEDAHEVKGTNRQWIQLPDKAAGETLTLRLWGRKELAEQTMKGNTYLGEKGAVFYQFFKDNLYALILGVEALLLSCVLLLYSIYLRHHSTGSIYRGTEYLTGFVLLTGIWIVTDSQFVQILAGKTGLISLISFVSFMVMPLFLLLFVQEVMIRRRRSLDILCILFLANLAVCLLVYLLRILPLFRCLLGTHFLIILSVGVVLKCGIEEITRYHNTEIRLIIAGFGILSLFGCAALGVFYYNPSYGYSYLFSAGMIFFVAFLAVAAIKKIYYHLEQSACMEVYRNLAYVDAMTCLANRNAFTEDQQKEKPAVNIAYLVFDINNLKMVNDQYGHQEGDKLIQNAADSIRNAFDRLGKCYRIGGDEFVVVIQEISEKEIEREIRRWEICVQKINRTRLLPMEIAWGFALRESADIPEKEVFAEADANMYHRKQAMKNRMRN
ncbi:MAG: diguanylate cyclase [Eubacteriales bacterium]|nr:diguanylate cyclase [Eubacteriales bacterium]